MIYLRKPNLERTGAGLAGRAGSFDYPGATDPEFEIPRGYNVDSYREPLGAGRDTFEAACALVRGWRMYPRGWTEVRAPEAPPRPGQTALVTARVLFLWILAPIRVEYVIDEEDERRARYGFAISTLAGHPERGEELFLVQWDRRDDTVSYSILAISRPAVWYAWLTYPLTRFMQRRFGRDSRRAMQAGIVAAEGQAPGEA